MRRFAAVDQNPEGHSPKWWKNHPEAKAKAEAAKASRAAVDTNPPDTESRRFIYLRTIGFSSFCLAIGAVLMEDYFPVFVVFSYLALGITIVDSVKEKGLGRFRYAIAGFFFLVALAFTFGVVIGTTKPTIDSNWFAGNYSTGTDINGITWNNGWSDLRLGVRDGTDEDLKDIDIEIRVDGWTVATKVIGDFCTLAAGSALQIRGTDQSGNQFQFPKGASSQTYHLMCSRIPAHMGVWVIIAMTNNDSRVLEKRKPDWISLRGKYKVKIRPYTLNMKIVPIDDDPLFMQKK
jgi:hypothetical protein